MSGAASTDHKREVSAALFAGQVAVADLEHVRIVPVVGSCVPVKLGLPVEDRQDARPLRLNVPRGPPEVAERARPLPMAERVPIRRSKAPIGRRAA